MKRLIFLFGLVFVFVATTTSFAEDSPLVQAAKKEKERRAKTEAKKVLTNQDIEEVRSRTRLGIEVATTEEAKTGEEKKAEKKESVEKDRSNDEEYWKGRRAAADERVKQAQARVDQLQSDINVLNQALNTGEGAAGAGGVHGQQLPLVVSERSERLNEMEEARKGLEDAKAELDGLEDEARQAGAPQGWVRE